ncbi:MAG TPA: hypothetical protein VFY72_08100, partial [Beijerinckiaceae bacterium]|nr:hypothetical protein [Beijerinckiaceae bacterium]
GASLEAVTRPAGESAFGPPVKLGGPVPSTTTMGPDGDVLLTTFENGGCFSCPSPISVRAGKSFSSLSRPQRLADEAVPDTTAMDAKAAVAPGGRMAVAWRTARTTARSGVQVALREPGKPFGAPIELDPRERTNDHGPLLTPAVAVAINEAGDALVAWTVQEGDREMEIGTYAAYRRAGGTFGPPRRVGSGGRPLQAQIGPDGEGHVLSAAPPRSYLAYVDRSGIAAGRPLAWGGLHQATANADGTAGATFLTRARAPGGADTTRVSFREPGLAFTPPRVLGAGLWPLIGIDGRGNMFGLNMSSPDWQQSSARLVTLNRFDLVPSQITPPLPVPADPISLSVNRSGQAAALVQGNEHSDPGMGPRGPAYLIERQADDLAPTVAVGVSASRSGSIRQRVRCSEACRVRASVTLPRTVRRRALLGGRRTLRPRARAILGVRLGARDRTLLRRVLRRHRATRIVARVRAEDSAGNVRRFNRRISARRLLR